ncbi:unnamed protein product [Rotaria sp. Silwood1]|nr:unnamed protein product [Rotaria sp. Silwood1]CAF1663416.1 unnamed protein product [Rotaria sp. Silwood1]CAF3991034.1 unnamed protein product [Rotaria sp. Silwood1]CAF4999071.1 unnamed protein product [Rotaria sp. Silwood1]
MGRKKNSMKDLNVEKENDIPYLQYTNSTTDATTNCSVAVGLKRPIELVDSHPIDNKEIEIINLKKQCIDLQQRVEILEKTCLLIPEHMNSIENFFHDIIEGSKNNNDGIMLNNIDCVTVNNDDVFTIYDNIIPVNNDGTVTVNYHDDIATANNNDGKTASAVTILNIDDATLGSLKKENTTSTARSILKYLYPNPELNFKLSSMDKTLVDAIISCTQKAHPSELTTTAKIRHAMSNYFGLLNYKKKIKSTISNKRVEKGN